MKGLHMSITADEKPSWRLYVIGDPHLDNVHTDVDRLKSFVNFVAKDEHAVVVIVGDFLDGTTPDHRHFEGKEVRKEILQDIDKYILHMLQYAKGIFGPLKDRNVIAVQGNHDRRGPLRFAGFVEYLAGEMGWQYAEDAALVGISVQLGGNRSVFRAVFVHHGAGGGMYPGGKVNRIQHTLVNIAVADFYVRGHVHDSFARVLHVWDVRKGESASLVRRPRVFLTAPAWYASRVAYADRRGYPVNDEGVIYLDVMEARKGKGEELFRVRRVEWF